MERGPSFGTFHWSAVSAVGGDNTVASSHLKLVAVENFVKFRSDSLFLSQKIPMPKDFWAKLAAPQNENFDRAHWQRALSALRQLEQSKMWPINFWICRQASGNRWRALQLKAAIYFNCIKRMHLKETKEFIFGGPLVSRWDCTSSFGRGLCFFWSFFVDPFNSSEECNKRGPQWRN